MTDPINPIDERSIRLAALFHSAAGEDLHRLCEPDGPGIELSTAPNFRRMIAGERIEASEVANATLGVTFRVDNIRACRDVPRQVAEQLATWGRQLLQASARVASEVFMESEAIELTGRAHLVQEVATGQFVAGSPFHDRAREMLTEQTEATGREFQIVIRPLSDCPELLAEFQSIVPGIVKRIAEGN